jgi:hypothetical protein
VAESNPDQHHNSWRDWLPVGTAAVLKGQEQHVIDQQLVDVKNSIERLVQRAIASVPNSLSGRKRRGVSDGLTAPEAAAVLQTN